MAGSGIKEVYMIDKIGNPFLDSFLDKKDSTYQEMEMMLKKVPLFKREQKLGFLYIYRMLREESYKNVGIYYPEVKSYEDLLNNEHNIKQEYLPNVVYLVSVRGQYRKLCGLDLYLLSQQLVTVDLVLEDPFY